MLTRAYIGDVLCEPCAEMHYRVLLLDSLTALSDDLVAAAQLLLPASEQEADRAAGTAGVAATGEKVAGESASPQEAGGADAGDVLAVLDPLLRLHSKALTHALRGARLLGRVQVPLLSITACSHNAPASPCITAHHRVFT